MLGTGAVVLVVLWSVVLAIAVLAQRTQAPKAITLGAAGIVALVTVILATWPREPENAQPDTDPFKAEGETYLVLIRSAILFGVCLSALLSCVFYITCHLTDPVRAISDPSRW